MKDSTRQGGRAINATSIAPQDRRAKKRFEIDCPVTVTVPGRDRREGLGKGRLQDIGESGARFLLDRPIAPNTYIILNVHFSHPDGQTITARFEGIVQRTREGSRHEVAVSFLHKGVSLKPEREELWEAYQSFQVKESDRWIQ